MAFLVANGASTNNAVAGHPHTDGSSTAHAGAVLPAANGGNGHPGAAGGSSAAGKINAVKDKYWVDVDQRDVLETVSGGDDGRPLLFQNKKVQGIILYPYRALMFVRLVAIILLFAWRIEHTKHVTMWLWASSIAGDVYFGLSWLLNQLPKLNPIKRVPDIAALNQRYDPADGSSHLPGIDAFVTTANPVDEPTLTTMNTVLSILAADYPVDRYACYLTDDSGALIQYEALVETEKFAELWVPFCRKHCVEPRAPENYFERKIRPYTGRAPEDFVNDHRRLSREYDEFKVHINGLWNTIRRRSDMYNSTNIKEGDTKATWMADGTQWPGTWIDPAENHSKGHHVGIVKVVLNQPSHEPKLGLPAIADNPLNFSTVDVRLPMLVYVSREKHPSYDNHKKAGNLNAQLRASALLSNAPFIINFDCDHYINNSLALRAAVCFMLDPREGDNTGFLQFPQRFDDVDPTDRYCNHNRVFFDATLLALDGFQGPSFLGTGCMFRRVALYGIDPPRWRPNDMTYKANKFGNSTSFLDSIPTAANQERSITPPKLDELVDAELTAIVSCAFENGTDWGRGVGFIYHIATEDVVTGFRIHRHGWRSMHCALEPEAFRGCAPINLTERLFQIMRWSAGSLEMFFSHNCPFLAGRRLQPMQRIAYTNMTIYPFTSLFILFYALYPVMWFFPEEFYIQRPFSTYVLYLLVVITMVHLIGSFEIKWSGITWLDWFRNEQFFTVGSVSVYPMAVLQIVMRLLTRKGVSFRVTSKQTTESTDEKYADLYVVRWVPLFIPAVVVLAVNIGGFGMGLGKMVVYHGVWSAAKMRHAMLGLMFNVWVLVLIYPFALAMMGRWSKRPFLLFIMLVVAFAVVSTTYVGVHSLLVSFQLFQAGWSERTIFPGTPDWQVAGMFRPSVSSIQVHSFLLKL